MSFILDALKKSESDRQRQSGPSLFEVKVAPPRRTLPVWAVAIAVLLGINIIVVSWMLLRRPAAQQPAPAANPPAAAPPAAVSGGAADSGARAVPPGAPAGQAVSGERTASGGERPDAMSGPGAPPAGMAGSAASMSAGVARRAAAPAAGAAAPRGTSTQPLSETSTPPGGGADQGSGQSAASPSGGSASDYAPAVQPAGGSGDNLPLYQQIASSAGIPELHLDLHVFADRPQDRFVMINMHRLGEGDSLPSGVQVEAIRPDGVELSYHGTRFLLPRN